MDTLSLLSNTLRDRDFSPKIVTKLLALLEHKHPQYEVIPRSKLRFVLEEDQALRYSRQPPQYQGKLLEIEDCAGCVAALERIAKAQEELVDILHRALDILQAWHESPPPLPKRGETDADQEEGNAPN